MTVDILYLENHQRKKTRNRIELPGPLTRILKYMTGCKTTWAQLLNDWIRVRNYLAVLVFPGQGANRVGTLKISAVSLAAPWSVFAGCRNKCWKFEKNKAIYLCLIIDFSSFAVFADVVKRFFWDQEFIYRRTAVLKLRSILIRWKRL